MYYLITCPHCQTKLAKLSKEKAKVALGRMIICKHCDEKLALNKETISPIRNPIHAKAGQSRVTATTKQQNPRKKRKLTPKVENNKTEALDKKSVSTKSSVRATIKTSKFTPTKFVEEMDDDTTMCLVCGTENATADKHCYRCEATLPKNLNASKAYAAKNAIGDLVAKLGPVSTAIYTIINYLKYPPFSETAKLYQACIETIEYAENQTIKFDKAPFNAGVQGRAQIIEVRGECAESDDEKVYVFWTCIAKKQGNDWNIEIEKD